VLVVDDVLATGGTARATDAAGRVGSVGAWSGFAFLLELGFLDGARQLEGYPVTSLLRF
jgi:adenine phosphoribosyltransferase